jgi:RNA polymerase sigma-70 factor (ECF subfamily)
MLYAHARRAARRTAEGGYVPLSEQDPQLWDEALIRAAEEHLQCAAVGGQLGRFQLEAAIQAAHVARRHGGGVSWPAIASLYEGLVRLAPTVGALVGRAAAVAEAQGPDVGWALLRELPEARLGSYAPYHALKGHLLERRGAPDEAAQAFGRAADLSEDTAEKRYLQEKAARCRKA